MGFGIKSSNPGDVLPPTAPSNVVAQLAGTTVTVTWSGSLDASGSPVAYQVKSSGGAFEADVAPGSPTQVQFVLPSDGVSRTFAVRSRDIYGNASVFVSSNAVVPGANTPAQWIVPEGFVLPATLPGQSVDVSQYAYDADGDAMEFAFVSAAPSEAGISCDAAGRIYVDGNVAIRSYQVVIDVDEASVTGGVSDPDVVLWQQPPVLGDLPATYGTVADPTYGTTIRVLQRMDDIAALHGGDFNSARTSVEYSQIQMWNADMTMFITATGRGSYVADYLTGRILFRLPTYQPDLVNFKWHPTRANEIIAPGNEANHPSVIWPAGWTKHNEMVVTKIIVDRVEATYQVYVTCSLGGNGPERATNNAYYRPYADTSGGSWPMVNEEGAIDPVTGDYWLALAGWLSSEHAQGGLPTDGYLFAVNTDKNEVTPEITVRSINLVQPNTTAAQRAIRTPDRWFMSPNAKHYVGAFAAGTAPSSENSLQGLQFFDRDTMTLAFEFRWATSGHSDTMLDSNGVPWFVQGALEYPYLPPGFSGHGIYAIRIDGVQFEYRKLLAPPYTVTSAGHFSGRHAATLHGVPNKDFIIASFYNEHEAIPPSSGDVGGMTYPSLVTSPPVAMTHEVVAIYLDSTPQNPHVLRLCHSQGSGDNYWGGQPHATISPDGTKVAFSTNWGDWPFTWIYPYADIKSHVVEVNGPLTAGGGQ